jgi:RNA polymerase sigma-70 factor (ECF subfamily)
VFAADRALAAAAAAGDEPALRTVLGRVTPKLRAIAWRMCHDHHEAQDLCQEALLKVSAEQTLRSYRAEGPLDAYLLNVGVRAILSVRRTRPWRDWRETTMLEALDDRPDPVAEPPAGIDPALGAALAKLSDRARLIVLLIAVGEYEQHEVAECLGLPLGTVKSTYSRARAALRHELAPHRLEPS